MDWGSTESGVPIMRSRMGVTVTPITVSSRPETMPSASSVWMAFCTRPVSRAPK